jgi:hypothetical protein
MSLKTVQEIERAIDALTLEQREKLFVWLDERYFSRRSTGSLKPTWKQVASMITLPAPLTITIRTNETAIKEVFAPCTTRA